MNQPPLNPDAVLYAVAALHGDNCPDDPEPGQACDCDAGHYERLAETAVSAYLAAALPEVTSVEEFLALHPGTYLLCADEVVRAKFLTVPREWMLPARVLYRPSERP